MPRPDNLKRHSMTLQEKCMQEREKLRLRTMKSLKADMWRLYNHAPDADLIVKPREGQFSVHRQLIQQRMPLLLQDLTSDEAVINLPNVSLEDAKELFRLIYMTDDLSLATEMAAGYLNNSTEGILSETAPTFNEDPPRKLATPDLVQGLNDTAMSTGSTDDLGDITSPTIETATPIGSTSSYPATPVDENLPTFIDAPAYLIGAVDVPYLPASNLGLDLLRLYLNSSDGDVVFQVEDQEFRGHKFLLINRCNYFEMMLGGAWVESNAQVVKLEGVSALAFHQALLYIYGGVIDLDTGCHVQDLLVLADMYGLEGLKDVVSYEIKKNYCHFFHKPCQECISKVADALCLSFSHGMEDLLHRILRWCDKYFVKMWPTKQFASLPVEILEKCCDTVSSDLTKDSVTDIIFDCDKLKGSIPQVKWAEPINKLAARLMEACIVYLQNNLFEVLESHTFSDLGKNMAWSLNFLDEVISTTVKQMPHSVSCKTFVSAYKLSQHADTEDCGWNDDFKVFVRALTEKCRQNLRNNISYLEFTPEFEQLPAIEQKTIKEGASFVSVGVSKAKMIPPKLSSDNKKFNAKKHGGIPFNLPKGVPPKAKLTLKAPNSQEKNKEAAAKLNTSSSSELGSRPNSGGARSKTSTAGSAGKAPKKTVAASARLNVSASADSGSKPRVGEPGISAVGASGCQEMKKTSGKTSATGACGGPETKKTKATSTRTSLSSASDPKIKPNLTGARSKVPAAGNSSSRPVMSARSDSGPAKKRLDLTEGAGRASSAGAPGFNRSVNVGTRRPPSSKSGNQTFDLGVKKLDTSIDQGASASKKPNLDTKRKRMVPAKAGAPVPSTSGIKKPPTLKSAKGAVGGRKSISPTSSDSGVSSVGSAADARPKRHARKSLGMKPPRKKPDPRLNISMPAAPQAQSTPMAKPSKLRQPQVHSPTKDRPGAALFKAPLNKGPKKSNIFQAPAPGKLKGIAERRSLGSQPKKGLSEQKKDVKKPPAISLDVNEDVSPRKSHLPVRSPVRKSFSASPTKKHYLKQSPAKSLPNSPIGGRESRSNSRLNQSCLPVPSSRPASGMSRHLSYTRSSPRREKPKPNNFCLLCDTLITGDNSNVLLPESQNFSFEVLPESFLAVDFVKP